MNLSPLSGLYRGHKVFLVSVLIFDWVRHSFEIDYANSSPNVFQNVLEQICCPFSVLIFIWWPSWFNLFFSLSVPFLG